MSEGNGRVDADAQAGLKGDGCDGSVRAAHSRGAGPQPKGGEGRLSDREKLIEKLSEWVFLFPEGADANLASQCDLGLSTASYHIAMLGRETHGRSYIVVARDDDDGVKAASLVVDACRRGRAKAAVLWRLDGFGTKHADLEAWSKEYNLEWMIGFEQPWRPKAKEPAETHSDVLLRLAQSIELFRTPDGDAYGTVTVKGRREHHPVTSEALASWLLHAYYQETAKVPTAEAMQNAIKILGARALYEEGTKEYAVALRVASDPAAHPGDPVYYLDLGDEARNAVKIAASGWEVVTELPVRFRRPRGLAPLPIPERGGAIDQLWEFLNVGSEEDRLLVVAALTCDFLPRGPYPLAVITGEQGSAKSTTTRLFKRLVDPRSPMLGSAPKDLRDLMVIAKSTWLLSFDNLSSIPVWLSDALSRLSTGGGFATRKLHSDDEEMFFEATRPIVLNSIEEIASRADLLDRSVVIVCPMIPDLARRQEKDFWAAFDRAYPRLLGALLDTVMGGMEMLPLVKLDQSPRMADFARWGEAVCRSLGRPEGAFLKAYTGNRDASAAAILEDSAIAASLIDFRRPGESWSGTNQQLLDALRDQAPAQVRDSPRWPKSPKAFSAHLRRIAPALRKMGVDVFFPTSRNKHRIFAVIWTNVQTTEGTAETTPDPLNEDSTVTNRHHRHQAPF